MMRWCVVLLALALVAGCGGDNPLEATDAPELELTDGDVAVRWAWSADVGSADGLSHGLLPAVSDGRVYAAGASQGVAAFDASSGDRIWQRAIADHRLAGGPAAGDGMVVIGTREGEVLSLDVDGGERRWQASVSSEVLAPAAIGQDSVVVRSNDGRVFALEAGSGERRWLYDRNVPPLTLRGYGSPVLVKGGVVAGLDNGRLVALTLADGSVAWEATVAVPSGDTDLEQMVDVDGTPRVNNAQVFATSYQGRAAGIAVGDGSVAWTRDISSATSPGLDKDKVYVSDADGQLWALDRDNGATVWRQDALSELELTAPRRFGGHLVVGASDGHVYWIAPEDGRVIARREIGGTRITAPPVVAGNRLYVQTLGGTLVAFTRPASGSGEG